MSEPGPTPGFECFDGFSSVRSDLNAVALVLADVRYGLSEVVLVLHQEDRLDAVSMVGQRRLQERASTQLCRKSKSFGGVRGGCDRDGSTRKHREEWLSPSRRGTDRVANGGQEIPRLENEPSRPGLERTSLVFGCRAHDNGWDRWLDRTDRIEGADPVEIGHLHVEHEHVERLRRTLLDRLQAVTDRSDAVAVALQPTGYCDAERERVVCHEDVHTHAPS
jgi:hypothetical protein